MEKHFEFATLELKYTSFLFKKLRDFIMNRSSEEKLGKEPVFRIFMHIMQNSVLQFAKSVRMFIEQGFFKCIPRCDIIQIEHFANMIATRFVRRCAFIQVYRVICDHFKYVIRDKALIVNRYGLV